MIPSTEKKPTLSAKCAASVAMFVGSLLAYIIAANIFTYIWDPMIRTPSTSSFVLSVILLWGGTRTWPQWRLPLGIMLFLFGVNAFCSSAYFRIMQSAPEVTSGPAGMVAFLSARSNGLIVVGSLASILGAGFLYAHRVKKRKEQAALSIV